jgi:ATP-dependent Zn protease
MSKSKAMTPAQRQAKLKQKLDRFGVRKCGVKLSESERAAASEGVHLTGATNREEFLHEAFHFYLKHLGISMPDINQRLQAGEFKGV